MWQQTAAEHGTPVSFPSKISDVINTTSYHPQIANGWRDFGQTVDGLSIARAVDRTAFDSDAASGVNEDVEGFTHTLATGLAETTPENLVLVWEGGAVVDVIDGLPNERYVPFGDPTDFTERRIAILFKDRLGYLWMYAFRRAQLHELGDAEHNRAEMLVTPCTFKLFPDTNIDSGRDRVYRLYTNKPAMTSTSTSTTSSTSTSSSTTSTSSSTTTTL